jgi:hypothetical protein
LRDVVLELGEDLPQVIGDGVLAEKEPRTDLLVGEPVASQPRDLLLPGSQVVARLAGPLVQVLAVASSSRRVRSANASIPIELNRP